MGCFAVWIKFDWSVEVSWMPVFTYSWCATWWLQCIEGSTSRHVFMEKVCSSGMYVLYVGT